MFRFLLAFFLSTPLIAEPFDLKQKNTHIIFDDDIPATRYSFVGDVLKAVVDKSASALVYAFDEPRKVSKVTFYWRTFGNLKVKNEEHERTKDGDDFTLRIGLILSGEPPLLPFFASSWVKAVRDALKHPTDKMLYLIPLARNRPGKTWVSPYSDSMSNTVLTYEHRQARWKYSKYKTKKPLDVVGIWVMADGDNTQSKFMTSLKSLVIE